MKQDRIKETDREIEVERETEIEKVSRSEWWNILGFVPLK